ncbi:HTH-type transcriptional regulator LrpA [Candidatus Bilamarchaeum dharawalense]|uniref:HTH-type transcriptional regulator LrpA n=1 Tax=Candidatus Bilamarchaeum dharawalense TaxID=2885759 RepID=A0A5E4LQF6_9ARCH|nr:HTH-type transcriptional regulator LrpA [Candidatus Bilamarchaeum dharawalense]
MKELDLLDRRIMYELDTNARTPASEIAKKLKKSKETINFRINRLIDGRYIRYFYTVYNTSKLGWYHHKVYVKFKNITPEKEKELFEYLLAQPFLSYLASVEGYYDCIFLVMARDSQDMVNFLHPFVSKFGDYIQQKDLVIFLTTHRLNNRFLYPGERADYCYQVPLGHYKLDETDQKILAILSDNARFPLTQIAKKLKLDPKTVKYRMKKLEKDNIILGYVSAPDFNKLGLQFVQINMTFKDPTITQSVIEYFNSTNGCLFAIELLGKYDLLVELHVKNNDELRSIVDGFRKKFVTQVNDYDVHTINKEYTMVWGPFSEKR